MINKTIEKTKEGSITWHKIERDYLGQEGPGSDVTHYIKTRMLRVNAYYVTTRSRGYEIEAYRTNDKHKIKELINLIEEKWKQTDLEKINKIREKVK